MVLLARHGSPPCPLSVRGRPIAEQTVISPDRRSDAPRQPPQRQPDSLRVGTSYALAHPANIRSSSRRPWRQGAARSTEHSWVPRNRGHSWVRARWVRAQRRAPWVVSTPCMGFGGTRAVYGVHRGASKGFEPTCFVHGVGNGASWGQRLPLCFMRSARVGLEVVEQLVEQEPVAAPAAGVATGVSRACGHAVSSPPVVPSAAVARRAESHGSAVSVVGCGFTTCSGLR